MKPLTSIMDSHLIPLSLSQSACTFRQIPVWLGFDGGWTATITIPTVLVLGAGASKPYGFPLGGELKDLIIKQIREPNNDSSIRLSELLSRQGISRGDQTEFAERLDQSAHTSVDAFLEEFSK